MESVILKDICEDIQYGYTTSAVSEEVGPKFLRITDIVSEQIDWKSVPYCKIKEKEFDKYVLRDGDIVIARTGATTGYAKYLKKPPRAVFASYLIRIKIKDGIDKRFIGYIVQSQEYKDFIKTIWGGAAQPNANAQVLTSFPILLPSYTNQQKISSLLSAYDDLIENNTRRIQILEEMAQLIYREWFVKFRFPGHKKVRFIDSEMGRIPEGWKVLPLGEVFDVKYGKTLPLKKVQKIGKYPVYGAGSVIGFYNEVVEQEKVALVTCRGNGSGTVWRTREASFITNNSFRIKPKIPSMNYFFTELLLKNSDISRALGGSAQPQITIESISYVPLLIAQKDIIERFIDSLKDIPELIDKLYEKNENLRTTRDLLLPKLISGEIDVSDLDIVVRDINEEK